MVIWTIEVQCQYKLSTECFQLAIHILNQFLSTMPISTSRLHLLNLTAVHMAAKIEEVAPPGLKKLMAVSEGKFSRKDVREMEHQILYNLEFNFNVPTTFTYLQIYCKWGGFDNRKFFFAQYLTELSMVSDRLMRFGPSELAAACLILTLLYLDTES